jgi:hypothetical protein
MQSLKKIGNVLSLVLFVVIYLISTVSTIAFLREVYQDYILSTTKSQTLRAFTEPIVYIALFNFLTHVWVLLTAIKKKKYYLLLTLLLIATYIVVSVVIYLAGYRLLQ